MLDGDFDHGAEVVVVLAADGDVAGIDAVLGERLRRCRIFVQQEVAVVVEVADDGGVPAFGADAFDDVGNGFGGVIVVDGDADQLGAGASQGGDLLDGGSTSAVSVLVIDWTTTGASEPTRMLPMLTVTAWRRWIDGMCSFYQS